MAGLPAGLRGVGRHEADATGQQGLGHGLLEGAGFGEAGFEGGDVGVHVGEDFGNRSLLGCVRVGNRNAQQRVLGNVFMLPLVPVAVSPMRRL